MLGFNLLWQCCDSTHKLCMGWLGQQEVGWACSFARRDLCLEGQENWKLCLRAVDTCCISQFIVRAVWKALTCGSIHETSDNGAEECSGELVNLQGLRWLVEGNVACRGKYLCHILSYCENSAGGSKMKWIFTRCLDGWLWVQFLGELVALQGRVCWWRNGVVWEAHAVGPRGCGVSCLVWGQGQQAVAVQFMSQVDSSWQSRWSCSLVRKAADTI